MGLGPAGFLGPKPCYWGFEAYDAKRTNAQRQPWTVHNLDRILDLDEVRSRKMTV